MLMHPLAYILSVRISKSGIWHRLNSAQIAGECQRLPFTILAAKEAQL